MKYKILAMITILSSILSCSSNINGPDFEEIQEKSITLENRLRINYQIPGNLSQLFSFEENYKKQPDIIDIKKINELVFKKDDWRESVGLDIASWEYYKGKRNVEKNEKAALSFYIEIHKSTTGNVPSLITLLQNNYEAFLNGDHGKNTEIRKKFPTLKDNELSQWIIPSPQLDTTTINNTTFITWKNYGEFRGKNRHYFITPINDQYYIALYFTYNISANSDKESHNIHTMINNDIEKIINQIQIYKI